MKLAIKLSAAAPANSPPFSAKVLPLPAVKAATTAALRSAILESCASFELALRRNDKDFLRALHLQAKAANPGVPRERIHALFLKHQARFRRGSEIDPARIKPVLKLVCEDDEWADLFAVVRSLWSMPYNKGYGRRLRFVVYDEYHEGVIGIIGLQSPPADLLVRDGLFEYPVAQKLEYVNCTMDAFAVGAVPPYSYLLGGKLCAGLISTDTVRQAYWRQYAGKQSQMQKLGVKQPLVAVTTTSALGRSSQYNRLRYRDRLLAEPLGFTLGYGTMHLESHYAALCDHLKSEGAFTPGGFGHGPKVRWQNITRALVSLGLPNTLLRHGVKRQVFLYRLVNDIEAGMAGRGFGAPIALEQSEFSDWWKERWALPRAVRLPDWNKGDELSLLKRTIGLD